VAERFEQLEAVNRNVREFAARIEWIDPDHHPTWEFVCECGLEGCAEHVRLPLSGYDELKTTDDLLLAPGHARRRARELRQRAQEMQTDSLALRADAAALRNQALHQQRRAHRIIEEARVRVPRFRCAGCGYGWWSHTLPSNCPRCRSNEWQAVRPT
jgi:predicted Zn-ribbon and HTH transcriptional regulator